MGFRRSGPTVILKHQSDHTTHLMKGALQVSPVTVARIEAVMQETNEERDQELDRCDRLFYKTPQGIPKSLYAFIKANSRIRL
jgi:hypothetical protein